MKTLDILTFFYEYLMFLFIHIESLKYIKNSTKLLHKQSLRYHAVTSKILIFIDAKKTSRA